MLIIVIPSWRNSVLAKTTLRSARRSRKVPDGGRPRSPRGTPEGVEGSGGGRGTRPRSPTLVEELGMLIAKTRKIVWMNATRRLEESGNSMLAWQLLAHLVRTGRRTQIEGAVALGQHPAGLS